MSTLERIRTGLSDLTPGESRVAAALLDAPEAFVQSSITDLAEAAGTGIATVVRCCQRLGFSGYQEVKLGLVRDLGPRRGTGSTDPLETGTGPSALFERVGRQIAAAGAKLDIRAFEAAVEAIGSAHEVLIIGFGTSASVAMDVAYRLQLLGIRTQQRSDPHQAHVVAASLGPDDVCLAVSHTGATRETLLSATAAEQSGATVIGLTSYHRSPLADVAHHVLATGIRGLQINLALGDGAPELPTVSRLTHLVIGDAIVAALAERDSEHADARYARNHAIMAEHLL